VWPHASGYSLDLDEQLNPLDGPLLDFTVYNPSLAWGTNLVSDMDDLARFYRALMGGRLLRSAQLAEMKTTVEVAPGYRWGLGLEVVDFACGPMWGHSGDVPGFANELFSSEDGTHQFGLMINAAAAPAAVYETIVAVDEQAVREAFAGMPCAAGAPSSGPQQAAAGGSAPRLLAGERWSRSAGS
jgi:D-alanyl-D-alanine carboxypeptidase